LTLTKRLPNDRHVNPQARLFNIRMLNVHLGIVDSLVEIAGEKE